MQRCPSQRSLWVDKVHQMKLSKKTLKKHVDTKNYCKFQIKQSYRYLHRNKNQSALVKWKRNKSESQGCQGQREQKEE